MAKWLDNAIFYEIYPQSFMDTNGDGIGDFQGIISKLDYIKSLGCNALWINPCFVSPFKDAGYDVADYYSIAPRYGTNEDAKQLFEEVHKRDMHILFDLVPGHTSVEHPWFKESMKADRNQYSDRYVWTDSIWDEADGMATIRGISDRDGSCVVNFFSTQPALNYGFYKKEKSWQQLPEEEGPQQTLNEMINVIRFWLNMGCDGFRVDMAGSLVKKDEEGKGTIALWRKVRAFLDQEFPDAAFVSEWGEPDKSLQGGFHMDFLLHFGPSHYNDLFRCDYPYFNKAGKGDVSEFVKKYLENYEKSERKGLICIPSGNHDMPRLAYQLDEEERKIAFAFLLSMPGAPFIYYGDEIGMRYIDHLRSVEGGFGRTGARTPMQWDDTKNAGFSSADKDKLYIAQDESTDRPTVAGQLDLENSQLKEVKKLIQIRLAHETLQSKADIEFVYAEPNSYPFAYMRSTEQEKILVVLNPSNQQVSMKTDLVLGENIYSFGKQVEQQGNTLIVPAVSANYYIVS